MHFIENELLTITVAAKGAELKSIYRKDLALEYMWSGDPEFWGKTSPVLFPIVGTLRNNSYIYDDKVFELSRHGFARDMVFNLTSQQSDAVTFTLESTDETLRRFPFRFSFSVTYRVVGHTLSVTYEVSNRGTRNMLFSVGGHPAFKLPLVPGTDYNDYRLVFSKEETAGRWPISKDGLIESAPQPLLDHTRILPLNKALFSKDALVLKHLRSDAVELVSDKTPHGIRFSFPGFSYLGLWAAPGADFPCIEPWCGIADSVNADQQLEHKEGIRSLQPSACFSVSWEIACF